MDSDSSKDAYSAGSTVIQELTISTGGAHNNIRDTDWETASAHRLYVPHPVLHSHNSDQETQQFDIFQRRLPVHWHKHCITVESTHRCSLYNHQIIRMISPQMIFASLYGNGGECRC